MAFTSTVVAEEYGGSHVTIKPPIARIDTVFDFTLTGRIIDNTATIRFEFGARQG